MQPTAAAACPPLQPPSSHPHQVDSFSVFQDIKWDGEADAPARVDNVVVFGAAGANYLRVEADASTDRVPLPGFTPRRGAGLPLLGKSLATPPAGPDRRVDFRFDRWVGAQHKGAGGGVVVRPAWHTGPHLVHATPPKKTPCRAAFTFQALPFEIPYPVPFRWLATQQPIEALQDEVK